MRPRGVGAREKGAVGGRVGSLWVEGSLKVPDERRGKGGSLRGVWQRRGYSVCSQVNANGQLKETV